MSRRKDFDMKYDTTPPEIPVFVYGTLKMGYGNHHLLDGAWFEGEGVTKERWPLDASSAIPFLHKREGEGERVEGELYLVDPETLSRLDALEGHPSFYRREIIEVELSNGVFEAWAYFIVRPRLAAFNPAVRWGRKVGLT